MKECRDIRELLSALLDDAVTADEQQRIAVHLAACTRCREALAELRRTVALVRDQEEVEPPPWLQTRIMARIAEEAAPRPSLWQRLFQPWPVKIPLHVVTLVALCITGYYLTRENIKQVDFAAPSRESVAPPAGAPAPEPGRHTAPAATPPAAQEKREQAPSAPAPRPTPSALPTAAPAATTAPPPPATPVVRPNAPEPLRELAPAKKVLSAPAERASEAPAGGLHQFRDAAPAPEAKQKRAVKEEATMQGAVAPPQPLILRFVANSPETAGAEIARLTQRLGGSGTATTPHSQTVTLPAQQYQAFLAGLARLGELHVAQKAQTASGQLLLIVSWE
jgi:hypothetical protein